MRRRPAAEFWCSADGATAAGADASHRIGDDGVVANEESYDDDDDDDDATASVALPTLPMNTSDVQNALGKAKEPSPKALTPQALLVLPVEVNEALVPRRSVFITNITRAAMAKATGTGLTPRGVGKSR